MARPQRIILIRHGQSKSNVDRRLHVGTPDYRIPLTQEGMNQAREAGLRLHRELHKNTAGEIRIQFYTSPYLRTRQTYQGILESLQSMGVSQVRNYEDPRLREQEFGNYQRPDDHAAIDSERDEFCTFFYRARR